MNLGIFLMVFHIYFVLELYQYIILIITPRVYLLKFEIYFLFTDEFFIKKLFFYTGKTPIYIKNF